MADCTARLRELAISETGFLFDPVTGHTYTLNRTGAELLKLLRDGTAAKDLPARLADRFAVDLLDAERDCALFLDQLRAYRLTA